MKDITLRKMSFNYLDQMHRILSNRNNILNTGLEVSKDYRDTVTHVNFLIHSRKVVNSFVIIDTQISEIVGFINEYYKEADEIEIACITDELFRNKGYMESAIRKILEKYKGTNIQSVYAKVETGNFKSKNLLRKLGFFEVEQRDNIILYKKQV